MQLDQILPFTYMSVDPREFTRLFVASHDFRNTHRHISQAQEITDLYPYAQCALTIGGLSMVKNDVEISFLITQATHMLKELVGNAKWESDKYIWKSMLNFNLRLDRTSKPNEYMAEFRKPVSSPLIDKALCF